MTVLARGRLALVTGASSGIGEAFATVLAERGLDLVVTARSEDRLRALADDLTSRHGVRVYVVPLDLAERGAPERLVAETERLGVSPDVLVNNAGFGTIGTFTDFDLEHHLDLVRVNVEAPVALARLYLPAMLARRSGGIVNVGSTASFQPIPNFAMYGASKAFVVSFSTALWAECRRAGVAVTAVCPGPVAETRFGLLDGGAEGRDRQDAGDPVRGGRTDGQHADRQSDIDAALAFRALPRRQVVEAALRALERGDPIVVPGGLNALGAALVRLVPLRLLLLLTERVLRGRARRRACRQ